MTKEPQGEMEQRHALVQAIEVAPPTRHKNPEGCDAMRCDAIWGAVSPWRVAGSDGVAIED